MSFKKTILLALTVLLAFCLSGCRSRVMPEGYLPPETQQQEGQPADLPEEQPPEEQLEEEPPRQQPEPQPDSPTVENPEAQRREYSADADAVSSPQADNTITALEVQPESPPAPENSPDGQAGGNIETAAGAELDITTEVIDENADKMTAEDSGQQAETMAVYYQTLLDSRLGSMFECQREYIYWEQAEEYRTIYKTSAEHQLITFAGGYDVSAKLLEDNLTVDDGWVARKNPGGIVKCVGDDVLGGGGAQSALESLRRREGWDSLDAVKEGKVILISQGLMETEARRLAAAVYIACAIYPDEFSDIDPNEALSLLTSEAEGSAVSGQYAFWG